MLMGVSLLYLHLALMGLVFVLCATLFRIANKISWASMLTIAVCAAAIYVTAINSLTRNSSFELGLAVLRSELLGAALGDYNLVIQNREYKLTRIPRDEDDLDNDEVDLNPEIAI